MRRLPQERINEYRAEVAKIFGSESGALKPLRSLLSGVREVRNNPFIGPKVIKFRGVLKRERNLANIGIKLRPDEQELHIRLSHPQAHQEMHLVVTPTEIRRDDRTLRSTFETSEVKANTKLSNAMDRIERSFRKAMGIREPENQLTGRRKSFLT